MATDKIPFTLRLPEEVLSELRVIAKIENRSINNLIEYFIALGVGAYNTKRQQAPEE